MYTTREKTEIKHIYNESQDKEVGEGSKMDTNSVTIWAIFGSANSRQPSEMTSGSIPAMMQGMPTSGQKAAGARAICLPRYCVGHEGGIVTVDVLRMVSQSCMQQESASLQSDCSSKEYYDSALNLWWLRRYLKILGWWFFRHVRRRGRSWFRTDWRSLVRYWYLNSRLSIWEWAWISFFGLRLTVLTWTFEMPYLCILRRSHLQSCFALWLR